jgi:hypothetical protein
MEELGFMLTKIGNQLMAKEIRQTSSGGWRETGGVYATQQASRHGKEKMRGVSEKLRSHGLKQVGRL